MRFLKTLIILPLLFIGFSCFAQNITDKVNVFLGSSGDHGQLSPAASSPFHMLSIAPQTHTHIHTGYERYAKDFEGFTHNRFEGVGCMGSGGILMMKPFIKSPEQTILTKTGDDACPGYYHVNFQNGIDVVLTVSGNSGMHHQRFPKNSDGGLYVDLAHTANNAFVAEEHHIKGTMVSGFIQAKTTCHAGTYKIYYAFKADELGTWEATGHLLKSTLKKGETDLYVRIGFSSVSEEDATAAIPSGSFKSLKTQAVKDWEQELSHIKVKGDAEREKLFYSLLYRSIQSPYQVSAANGDFRATDGSLQNSKQEVYNGWAIWDNYRTQLPLLSLAYADKFPAIAQSVARLYKYGKRDYATDHEPSNSVRTEHAVVVLLDAYKKGVPIDFESIYEPLKREVDKLDFKAPDKELESSYDTWAFSQILSILHKDELSEVYRKKALNYKDRWNKEFKDLDRDDVDRMQARGMYQGTIWQYRWFVPFDVKGLINLVGSAQDFTNQLDEFFKESYYNHANEPDIQVPFMYNRIGESYKSQALVHQLALDTVTQFYFNDNSRGVDPYIGLIYQNQPKAFLRTMDDDAGAMSSWFVLAAVGMFPVCVGEPVYDLNVPFFPEVELSLPKNKTLKIKVKNFGDQNSYIKSVKLNGNDLGRTWITQNEIMKGGELVIEASGNPQIYGNTNIWINDATKKYDDQNKN